MKTICEARLKFDRLGGTWNAQLWHSYDGGKTFVYAGIGRFFKDDEQEEMRAYVEEHRTPLPVFPLVTPERQQAYEQSAESPDGIPCICGYYGRACYRMGDCEGANRAICSGCKLADYCHAVEMTEYANS